MNLTRPKITAHKSSIMEVTFNADGRPIRYSSGKYARWFITEVLSELESGVAREDIFLKYKIKKATLDWWVSNFASAQYKNKIRRHTAQLKNSIARAVSAGRMTIDEARAKCNVSTSSTIKRWIKDYQQQGNSDLAAINAPELAKKKITAKATTEHEQIKQLQQQLADEKLKVAALNTLIDVAEEHLKINIRKKPGARQS